MIWKPAGAAILLIATTLASAADDLQAKRLAMIGKLTNLGIIYKLEKPASLCHLWVGPQFASLPFDDKKEVVGVVYACCITSNPNSDIVVLKDSRTGKEIGDFSKYAGGLRLK